MRGAPPYAPIRPTRRMSRETTRERRARARDIALPSNFVGFRFQTRRLLRARARHVIMKRYVTRDEGPGGVGRRVPGGGQSRGYGSK